MRADKLAEKTKKDLLEIARKLSISGRSAMSKEDLIRAITAGLPAESRRAPRSAASPKRAATPEKQPAAAKKRPVPRESSRAPEATSPPETSPPEAGPRSASPRKPGLRETTSPPKPPEPPQPPPERGLPYAQRFPRDTGPHNHRRAIPPIDPAMKLSRVEEIRASSPGRRPGPPGQRGGERGATPRDRHGGRLPLGGDPNYRQQMGPRHGRDWDRDHRRERWDQRDQRAPQSRSQPDQRSLQGREHTRRTHEGRRSGGHASPYERSRDAYRIEPPRPAPIPSRLSNKVAPPPERPRPSMDTEGGPTGHPVEVPGSYGVNRLAMMARDPFWLHAYWEVTPESIERAREDLGEEWDGHRWILRIQVFRRSETSSASEHFDVDLNPEARNWYLRVPHSACSYEGTIGVITRDGTFYPFARSGRVSVPPHSISEDLDEEWTTLPETAEKIYALSGGRGDGRSSADVVERQRAEEQEAWFSGMLGSMGSGAMGARRHRGFWFQVNTELILYGATQPDAQLTVQGRAIRLRPDGTFTLRFQLPDGVQEIPCVAKSADASSERTITPVVSRQTSSSEQEHTPESE